MVGAGALRGPGRYQTRHCAHQLAQCGVARQLLQQDDNR